MKLHLDGVRPDAVFTNPQQHAGVRRFGRRVGRGGRRSPFQRQAEVLVLPAGPQVAERLARTREDRFPVVLTDRPRRGDIRVRFAGDDRPGPVAEATTQKVARRRGRPVIGGRRVGCPDRPRQPQKEDRTQRQAGAFAGPADDRVHRNGRAERGANVTSVQAARGVPPGGHGIRPPCPRRLRLASRQRRVGLAGHRRPRGRRRTRRARRSMRPPATRPAGRP